jgi:hypothetical protein
MKAWEKHRREKKLRNQFENGFGSKRWFLLKLKICEGWTESLELAGKHLPSFFLLGHRPEDGAKRFGRDKNKGINGQAASPEETCISEC